jgi:uncharacterized protein (TIGR02996 family)
VNEEACFISALLADANDRTTLLVYADWLDERGDSSRAEYLRLLAAEKRDRNRLAALHPALDPVWVRAVRDRLAPGCTVRMTGGPFANQVGTLTGLNPNGDKVLATVRLTFWGRPLDVETDDSTIERADPTD